MQNWSNEQMWLAAAVIAILLFAISVIARIRALSKQSAEIHKKLDYSKMKKWEDEDDWGDSESSSQASESQEPSRFD